MKLKCRINNKDYDIVQGATFSDQFSETLDSGSIVIAHVKKIHDLEPYDDVFIWNADESFNGYGSNVQLPTFYKHLLVDRFSETKDVLTENIYTYKIELFSETKRLEKIILPNINITQPLEKTLKTSSYDYIKNFLDLYGPLIKISTSYNSNTRKGNWEYQPKYSVSNQVKELFEKEYCYDFSLNLPSLRELLSKIMITKDCIPYIKDDVLYAMKLSERKGAFVFDKNSVSTIIGTKTSSGYTDTLKTTYSNALSKNTLCHRVECLGFRNSDDGLLTLDNLRIETAFPIYKINKIYVCYYKTLYGPDKNNPINMLKAPFLCKQDITKLCVLANERELLWKDARLSHSEATTVDFMKNYYYYTLPYSIGSNIISGFGKKFSIKNTFGLLTWNKEYTVIQNILMALDQNTPYGSDYIKEDFKTVFQGRTLNDAYAIYTSGQTPEYIYTNKQADIFSTIPLTLKTLFFIVDYEGFYNGAIEFDKTNNRSNVTTVDNQNASLTILEQDGISKQSKINKFGNKSFQINTRYDTWLDANNQPTLQDLATVVDLSEDETIYNNDDNDVVIFNRDYSIWDNGIEVRYDGAKSYVLKNYFTSVYAKQRLFNVLDYGSSVQRAENYKNILLFSKSKLYTTTRKILYSGQNVLSGLLSCFYENSNTRIVNAASIGTWHSWSTSGNYAAVYDREKSDFFTDENTISCGNSLIFNLRMPTNFSMGNCIVPSINSSNSTSRPYEPSIWLDNNEDENFKGTLQRDNAIYDDYKTGRIEKISFSFGVLNKKIYDFDAAIIENNAINPFIKKLIESNFKLPYVDNEVAKISYGNVTNTNLKNEYEKRMYINDIPIMKDTKEQLDVSFQIEALVDADDENKIFINDKFWQLSDYCNKYRKLANYNLADTKVDVFCYQYKIGVFDFDFNWSIPTFVVKMKDVTFNSLIRAGSLTIDDINLVFQKESFLYDDSDIPTLPDSHSKMISKLIIKPKQIIARETGGGNKQVYLRCERTNYVYEPEYQNEEYYYEGNPTKPYGEIIMHWKPKPIGYSTADVDILMKNLEHSEVNDSNYSSVNDLYFSNVYLEESSDEWDIDGNNEEEHIIRPLFYDIEGSNINAFSNPVIVQPNDNYMSVDTLKLLRPVGSHAYTPHSDYYAIDTASDNMYSINMTTPGDDTRFAQWVGMTTNEKNQADRDRTYFYLTDKRLFIPNINTVNCGSYYVDDKVNNKNMLLVLSKEEITPGINFEKKTLQEFANSNIYTITNASIPNVFSYSTHEININVSQISSQITQYQAKSIQYWYYDYTEDCCSFVFGVNLSEEDYVGSNLKNNITIYLSEMIDKDTRVFDSNRQLIGYLHNFAHETHSDYYLSQQKFDGLNEDDD